MQENKRERLSPVDFYEREVLPALFDSLDRAFPDFGWKREGSGWTVISGWTATNRDFTKTNFGARPDRVVCNVPRGFLVHGGDHTSWVSYVSNVSVPRGRDFVEAVRTLAGLVGVDSSPLDRPLSPEEEALVQEQEARAALLEKTLQAGREALYESRSVDVDSAFPYDTMEIWNSGMIFLRNRGFGAESAGDFGFVADVGELDSRWKDRLLIPLRDRYGVLKGLAARALDGTEPKYLYLKGTRKAEFVAFGLDVALRSKEGMEDLVLVEGVLDPFLLQVRGFPNVAAIGGSGRELSTGRWEALGAFGVRSVTLALDRDDAGFEGLLAALENVSKGSNVPEVYVADPETYEDAKDPGELVQKKGLEAFQKVLEGRKPAALYRALVALEGITPESPDHKRREAVVWTLDYDARLRGPRAPLDREDLFRLTAEKTGYSFEALTEMAEDHTVRRRKENAEKDLDAALRSAQAERREGESALEVTQGLTRKLASLQARTVEAPPAFSVERLDEESRKTPAGKLSGWEALDELEVRFNAGELSLLAARTGHGKTSALVGLVKNWLEAEDEEEILVLYSQEEPEVRVFHRLLALVTSTDRETQEWDSNEVRDYLRDPESRGLDYRWPKAGDLDKAKELLRSWEDRLLVVHRPAWTVTELEAHARDLGERRKVGAVLVDYLQRIPGPRGSYDRRDLEVSAVARCLKGLAEGLQAPVVAGAQINRQAVQAADKVPPGNYEDPKVRKALRSRRPKLHHLREGGSEQEADLVLGLMNYRADYENEEDHAGGVPDVTRLEVGLLKARYGEVGKWAALAFEGRYHLLRDRYGNEEP